MTSPFGRERNHNEYPPSQNGYTDRNPLTITHRNGHEPQPAMHRILSSSTRPSLRGQRPAFCSPIRSRTESRKRTTNQSERKVMNNSKNNENKKVRGMSRKQFLKTAGLGSHRCSFCSGLARRLGYFCLGTGREAGQVPFRMPQPNRDRGRGALRGPVKWRGANTAQHVWRASLRRRKL